MGRERIADLKAEIEKLKKEREDVLGQLDTWRRSNEREKELNARLKKVVDFLMGMVK